ncbi:FAD dependent oxidoreductase [Hyaloscypha variabilis F]|uniref:FAD dependent oxidoreductase n=1 Tax=Hyaloscypha variabilis (strain UAMH 11265 / GT02V1 / F) TaxID=1149755 RepID=A0A2J6RXR3_HYAVF|nr:FAD dependent oxidoreductase [Hyaloscypha variabilis F]
MASADETRFANVASNIFPVSNSTTPYWRTELHEIDSIRSSEDLPSECDVLIVGAGLSGVSTAYHLLDDNPSPPSIVLLEAREVCSGATGRNGGHLMMIWSWIDEISKEFGLEAAKEVALFQRDQVYAMKAVAEKEKLDCDAILTRCFEVVLDQRHFDAASKVYQKQLEDGLDFIQDVNFVGPKHAEKLSGVKGAKGGVTTTALQLWPYKFVSGLLSRLLERSPSLNVQTHTPVTSIIASNDGTSIVHTPRGTIRAQKIVFATNGYTTGIVPEFEKKIVPIKISCSHISAPEDSPNPPPQLTHTYGLSYTPSSRDYLIPRPDGGVICGGARYTYKDDQKLWFNRWDDSTVLEATRPHFESVMQKNFRGWEKSGAAVDYLWSGIIGHTADGYPLCGKVPGKENHFILAGYNGGGMPHIFLTAKGIAKMIREDAAFEKSGIPRIFKITEERLRKDVQPRPNQ